MTPDYGASPQYGAGRQYGASPQYAQPGGLNWLLDDLVNRVPEIGKAVMLTQDGLPAGASSGLTREDAEHLAALSSGFQSMARGAGEHFGGGRVRQTVIEMEAAYLFVSAAGQGTCLAVLTSATADVGLVAYEMAVLVGRANEHLGVASRAGGQAATPQPAPVSSPAAPPPTYAPSGRIMPPSPAPPGYSPYSRPAAGPSPHPG